MDQHSKIVKILVQVWEDKDFELLRSNLADNVQWYEGSYAEPLTNPDQVVEQWKKDLAIQENIKAPTQVMGTNGAEGYYHSVARWDEAGKGHREMDGIFLIRLNSDGKIKYFNSWWNERPA